MERLRLEEQEVVEVPGSPPPPPPDPAAAADFVDPPRCFLALVPPTPPPAPFLDEDGTADAVLFAGAAAAAVGTAATSDAEAAA